MIRHGVDITGLVMIVVTAPMRFLVREHFTGATKKRSSSWTPVVIETTGVHDGSLVKLISYS